ncbi:Retrovirus-related Pol polyprotein from type-1 retrotransposable element R2, partial [Durusdinium trenchii]
AISDPVGSDTGLPEGDSMSCVCMVLLNFVFHAYMSKFAPGIRELSYVDNLQLVSQSVGSLIQGQLVAETWADMLQLQIDSAKSTYWGTTASLRSLKAQLIRTTLLPRSLHGAEQTFRGCQWNKQLRTHAMRSLGTQRAGANPAVRLSLVENPLTDPMYYDFRRCIVAFGRYCTSDASFRSAWRDYAQHYRGKATHGPFGKLQRICGILNWSIASDLELHTSAGKCYDLVWLPQSHLLSLFLEDWQQLVARGVFHRQDFAGLSSLDYCATFQRIENLSVSQRELLSTIRDGTLFLHTFKARFDPGFSELCPFCSRSLDTMEHRACERSYFQSVRERHVDCWTMWSDVPVALSHHGWTPANERIPRFHDELERLVDAPVLWQCEPDGSGVQHIFTDGSWQLPSHPIGQLSSWACELANTTQILASGLLPGRWQGIARAELYAVLQSLLWAAFHEIAILHLLSNDLSDYLLGVWSLGVGLTLIFGNV